jgi:hypothetical protein
VNDQADRPSFSDDSRLTATSEAFIGACVALILDETRELVANLFARLDEMRKDLADKAATDSRYTGYEDAVRIVYGQRSGIEARFLKELETAFEQMRSGHVAPVSSPDSDISNHFDLDPARAAERQENLVLNNLISKAEIRYSAQLQDLNSWFSDQWGVPAGENPLGPRAICGAFRSALTPLYGLDLSTRLVVYKLFDKQVMDGLEGLYARFIKCAEGALPETFSGKPGTCLDSEVNLSGGPADRRKVSVLNAGGVYSEEAAPAADTASPPPTFNELRQLLERWRPEGDAVPAAVRIGTRQLIGIVARLESELAFKASGRFQSKLLRLRLRYELRSGRFNGRSVSLEALDDDTLNLVFLVFEHLFQGSVLDDAVKDQIGRLQIPVARLCLEDKGFFDDARHPVRCLLNHLAETALGWVDDGDRGSQSVLGRIEAWVRQVLDQPERDIAFFSRLDAEIVKRLTAERKQSRDAEERVRQEAREREARHSAETVVRDLIAQRLSGFGEVPEALSSLVHEGWEQVMLAAYREGGTSGESWNRSLAILDRLIWSVRPKVADDDRRELLRRIPELLRTLREALDQVNYDQRRLAAAFRELQALHITALRRLEQEPRQRRQWARAERRRGPSPGQQGFDLSPEPVSSRRDSWQDPARGRPVAQGLRVGTWLEVLGETDTLRVKLAWRGADSGKYLFVDRRGQKTLELSDKELKDLFAQGAATIVGEGDRPIVDQAIEALVRFLEAQ